jgi:hypothetical protein
MVLGLGDELGASGSVAESKKLLLHRMATELAPGGAAVERGPALETEEDTHAAQPPREFSSFANPTTRRNSSGLRSDWARPKVTGRPDRRDTSPIQATSARVPVRSSLSRSPRRDALSNTPRRCRPNTSAKAYSSSGVAHVPGTGRPSGTVCRSVREVEKPSAPASMASSTSSTIAAMSSSVAGVSSMLRSPMAWWRTAQCPTMPPTLGPFGSRSIVSRYSPYDTQSQGRPSRMASRGMSSTLSMSSAR